MDAILLWGSNQTPVHLLCDSFVSYCLISLARLFDLLLKSLFALLLISLLFLSLSYYRDMYFGLSWVNIGLCVAAYQGARVVTSALSLYIPRISHFLGTCLGLAGYITVLLCNKDSIRPFVIGTAIVGFSETLSSMQKYAKEIFKNDPDWTKGQMMLKYQYASVMIGVVFAFSIGGFVYQKYKINGVAVYGIIVEGGELLALILFFLLEKKHEQAKNTDATTEIEAASATTGTEKEEHQKRDLEEHAHVSFRTSLAKTAHTTYATSDIGPTWINWLICLSFGIEALTIGFNLSVGPIFILQTFKKDTGIIGVLFAVGAASGSFVAIVVTCTSFGNKLMGRIALPPFDICFAMCGIGVGVLIAAIPNFPGHVVGLIILMCFNDLGAMLMTELQASITTASSYSTLAPAGQVVRRSLSVVTALTGPVLYGIIPRLPYYIAGGITLAWTIMIFVLFKIRTKQTVTELSTKTGLSKREIKSGWSFATREVIRLTEFKIGKCDSLIGKQEHDNDCNNHKTWMDSELVEPHVGYKKVLVTGGAGFIGSHVAEDLLARGDDVVIIDEINDYYDIRIKESNLQMLKDTYPEEGRVSIYKGDICDRELMEHIFAVEKLRWVCHMAARAGVRPSIQDPFIYIHSNINATTQLMELSHKYGVENFVFASSSSVYGGSKATFFSEDEVVDRPVSPYAASKKTCELLAYTYHHLYQLNVTGLRFFTVYGPRGRPDMAPSKFIDLVTRGKSIQQYGDGTSSRDYTYISDIVDGVLRSIDRCHKYEIFNLGKGSGTTLNKFISMVQKGVGRKAVIEILPDQPGDVPYTCADVAKAKHMLGYNAQVTFEEGIRRTAAWYKKCYGSGSSNSTVVEKKTESKEIKNKT